MRDLVEFLAKSLVDQPEAVKTSAHDRGDSTIIELEVAPDDLGKVIGRQGRTARAMRIILTAASSRERRRFILDIVD